MVHETEMIPSEKKTKQISPASPSPRTWACTAVLSGYVLCPSESHKQINGQYQPLLPCMKYIIITIFIISFCLLLFKKWCYYYYHVHLFIYIVYIYIYICNMYIHMCLWNPKDSSKHWSHLCEIGLVASHLATELPRSERSNFWP